MLMNVISQQCLLGKSLTEIYLLNPKINSGDERPRVNVTVVTNF